MGIFDRKQGQAGAAPAPGMNVPFQQVKMMKAQGYSNNQIIQTLQHDGFSSSQIFDALNGMEASPGPLPAPGQEPLYPQQVHEPEPMQQQQAYQPAPYTAPQQYQAPQEENVEELVEAIIDEKWNDLVKDINKIIDWKNKTENRMSQLEQSFSDLKSEFDKVHAAIIGKIGEYDKNILDVGAELKAMEKVFSKVLPEFTQNVSELSRISETFKGKKDK